jgi:hypothetical protein
MSRQSIKGMNPWVYQQEIMDFAQKYTGWLSSQSAPGFADDYDNEEHARQLFDEYVRLSTTAWGFMGVAGLAEPAPTSEQIIEQLSDQRRLRRDMQKLNLEQFGEDPLEDEDLSNISVDHQSIWLEVWEDTGNNT